MGKHLKFRSSKKSDHMIYDVDVELFFINNMPDDFRIINTQGIGGYF